MCDGNGYTIWHDACIDMVESKEIDMTTTDYFNMYMKFERENSVVPFYQDETIECHYDDHL